MKNIVTGIFAHVDSGKTTLAEIMLYRCKSIRKIGRVDHGDTSLDTNEIEKSRGITVFSKQARLVAGDTTVYLLDTPGHVDFSAETQRSVQAIDYGILVINGNDGIQNHTKTLWKYLKDNNIPTFIFVNKMDLAGDQRSALLLQIKKELSADCIDFSNGGESVFEEISLYGEDVMNVYLEKGTVPPHEIASIIKQRKIFPCVFGSALKDQGVDMLLDMLDKYTVSPIYKNEFAAKVYKISHDDTDTRLTFIKITGGEVSTKDTVKLMDGDGKIYSEKVNQIRFYTGDKFELAPKAQAGCICALAGLVHTFSGQTIGEQARSEQCFTQPVFTYRVIYDESINAKIILDDFRILEEEDPQLNVIWNEQLREIHISLMGTIQREILKSLFLQRFSINIDFDKGNVLYKETIKNTVEGVGHYEPLKHYAEVHLLLEPLKAGSGLVFETLCSEDALGGSWQRLILSHLKEKEYVGVLTASPITDIKITLVKGKAHVKHTEGGDFRQATYRAVRNGLMQAENVLLEPWYDFAITVPTLNIGRVMSDVQKMGGSFDSPKAQDENTLLTGSVPVSQISDYQSEIINFSKGKGSISFMLKGYFPCQRQEEIVQVIGYNPENDLENTADSVFCTHGAGVLVKWYDVKEKMHLESFLKPKREEPEFVITESQVKSYYSVLEQDKELMKIFEQTYGKIKTDKYLAFSAQKAKEQPVSKPMSYDQEYLLVDGYNIIFAWDELKEIAKENIEAARSRLINQLCNYQGFKQCQVIVVFDAYKVKGSSGSIEKYHNITIVYTKEAETADMYIEKVTHGLSGKCLVRVATSDGLEQIIILGHGAYRISAASFENEVKQVEEAIRQLIEG